MVTCRICGDEATIIFRCEEHNLCDDCSTKENLCHYTEGLLCRECHRARVEKRIAEFKGDTDYTKKITCPYCGYKFDDSWEYENTVYELDCPDCENQFDVEIFVTVNYSTFKQKVTA